jgi:hypothetical protein
MFLVWLILGVVPLIWVMTFLIICLAGLAQVSENRAGRRELSDTDARFLHSCGITATEGPAATEERVESCHEVGSQP